MSRRKDFIDSLVDSWSRLHRAAATQTEHQVRDLINQGADPNLRNWRGETPLHRAAIRNPDLDVHRALIAAGADVNARDEKGATPLHRAAPHASPGRGVLLMEVGASLNARDNAGATPLHYAAESGRDRMIARLIEAGASSPFSRIMRARRRCELRSRTVGLRARGLFSIMEPIRTRRTTRGELPCIWPMPPSGRTW